MQVDGKELEIIRWNGVIEVEDWYYMVVCGVWNGFKGCQPLIP